jgi:hypothetical protein
MIGLLCFALAVLTSPFKSRYRTTINLAGRIAARKSAPVGSFVASSILLPAWGGGGRARRWPGFRSARPPPRGLTSLRRCDLEGGRRLFRRAG